MYKRQEQHEEGFDSAAPTSFKSGDGQRHVVWCYPKADWHPEVEEFQVGENAVIARSLYRPKTKCWSLSWHAIGKDLKAKTRAEKKAQKAVKIDIDDSDDEEEEAADFFSLSATTGDVPKNAQSSIDSAVSPVTVAADADAEVSTTSRIIEVSDEQVTGGHTFKVEVCGIDSGAESIYFNIMWDDEGTMINLGKWHVSEGITTDDVPSVEKINCQWLLENGEPSDDAIEKANELEEDEMSGEE